jgi:dye decolorizing peroxidase
MRWQQRGFAHVDHSKSPRNLMGQVEGSGNPTRNSQSFEDTVWNTQTNQSWFAGGTSLVLRRIRMQLDTWESIPPEVQEKAIGRNRRNGAPLTGKSERDIPDLLAKENGEFVIADDAHIRRATTGLNIFRRVFNYDDGILKDGQPDIGLLFATFQGDPATYVEIQTKLAEKDALNRWTIPVGSGLWAIPGGVQPTQWLAEELFD